MAFIANIVNVQCPTNIEAVALTKWIVDAITCKRKSLHQRCKVVTLGKVNICDRFRLRLTLPKTADQVLLRHCQHQSHNEK